QGSADPQADRACGAEVAVATRGPQEIANACGGRQRHQRAPAATAPRQRASRDLDLTKCQGVECGLASNVQSSLGTGGDTPAAGETAGGVVGESCTILVLVELQGRGRADRRARPAHGAQVSVNPEQTKGRLRVGDPSKLVCVP